MSRDSRRMAALALALALLASCDKQDYAGSDVSRVTFSAAGFTYAGEDGLPSTRTYVVNPTVSPSGSGDNFRWAEKDTVGIYPSQGSQIWFSMSSGAGASTAEFDGGGWGLKSSAEYYSYYPFIGDIYLDKNRIPVLYTGQKQVGAGDASSTGSHIGAFDYMYAKGSLSGGGIGFNYNHLGCIIYCRVVAPAAGKWIRLGITAPGLMFVSKGWYDLTAASPAINGTKYSEQLVIELENVESASGEEFYVFLVSAPVDFRSKEITVSLVNDQRKEYQCKKSPSREYVSSSINGLGCTSWTEVPQSMGLILDDWGDGGSIGGTAD